MRKTLEQSEIDALFSKAQAAQRASRSKPLQKIVPWDLRGSNQLTADQLLSVSTLHESLARRLSGSIGAHLRVAFEMTLVSVEQLAYREFLGRLPDITYFSSMHVMPIDARAAVQLDISLAYPVIDVVLGGNGTEAQDVRDLTEIEEQILESVFRLILLDLHATWAPVLDLDFKFEQRQRNVEMQNTMLPGEKILCLSFEARIAETSGTLAMVFPAVITNALLRKLSVQGSYSERIPSRDTARRMRERIMDCHFLVDLSLPPSAVTIRELVSLEKDQVLMLPQRSREPVRLNIAGKPMFRAHPVRHGTQRGARIEERVPLSPSTPKGN
ncbi:MAG: flagellar motor switch protein FliM [Acidobacteria bacterium]|nr:flagellar motor switch protein FliM [Acidobacteriota bacterium]MBS1865617.1 flagellar motor switch protein FliM [Acidobacteriota bacterium]